MCRVIADETCALHEGIEDVTDAFDNSVFKMRGAELATVMDSRGAPKLLLWKQSPAHQGSCHLCPIKGFHHFGKTVYPGSWRALPLHAEAAADSRPYQQASTFLRQKCSTLQPLAEDLAEDLGGRNPQNATLPELHSPEAVLASASAAGEALARVSWTSNGVRRAANSVKQERKRVCDSIPGSHGERGYCPMLDVPKYNVSDYQYDAMHTIGNIAEDLVLLFRGKRVLTSDSLSEIIEFEQSRNHRFQEWTADDATSAPFVMFPNFDQIIDERLKRAKQGAGTSWAHATSWQNAFGAPNGKGSYPALDKSDWWFFCSPVATWAMTGAWDTQVYEDLANAVVQALDGLKFKTYTEATALLARSRFIKALSMMEGYLPVYELDHKLHQMEHLSRNLPLWWYSAWTLERGIREVTSHLHNPARPTASMAHKFAMTIGAHYTFPSLCRELERPYDEYLQPDIAPAEPEITFHGSCKVLPSVNDNLWLDLHMHLLDDATWAGHRAYFDLWEEYQGTFEGELTRTVLLEKLKGWNEWAISEEKDAASKFLTLGPKRSVTKYSRATIEGVIFREKRLDRDKKTQGSFFVARYHDQVDDVASPVRYEVGQALGFYTHEYPDFGETICHDVQYYVHAQWPVVPSPSRTSRSNMPMIVEGRFYKDEDYGGHLNALWRAKDVQPMHVCIATLDNLHDVPRNVEAVRVTNTALRYYKQRAERLDPANSDDPPGGHKTERTVAPLPNVRLAAVLTPHFRDLQFFR